MPRWAWFALSLLALPLFVWAQGTVNVIQTDPTKLNMTCVGCSAASSVTAFQGNPPWSVSASITNTVTVTPSAASAFEVRQPNAALLQMTCVGCSSSGFSSVTVTNAPGVIGVTQATTPWQISGPVSVTNTVTVTLSTPLSVSATGIQAMICTNCTGSAAVTSVTVTNAPGIVGVTQATIPWSVTQSAAPWSVTPSSGSAWATTVTNFPATQNVSTLGINAANIQQWGSANTSLGQKTMAASLPVAIASDQSVVSVTLAAPLSVAIGGTVTVTMATPLSVSPVGMQAVLVAGQPLSVSATGLPAVLIAGQPISVSATGVPAMICTNCGGSSVVTVTNFPGIIGVTQSTSPWSVTMTTPLSVSSTGVPAVILAGQPVSVSPTGVPAHFIAGQPISVSSTGVPAVIVAGQPISVSATGVPAVLIAGQPVSASATVSAQVYSQGTQPVTAASANQRQLIASQDGALFVQEGNSNRFSCVIGNATVTTQCQAAPAANLRAYVTGAYLSNSAATVQTLTIVQGTGANCATSPVALTHAIQMGTNATTTSPMVVALPFITPLVPTAATAICVRPSLASAFGATLTGFIAP